jgi:hypothetical protein
MVGATLSHRKHGDLRVELGAEGRFTVREGKTVVCLGDLTEPTGDA